MTYLINLLLSGFGLFTLLKFLILTEIRLDSATFYVFWNETKNNSRQILFANEMTMEERKPIIYKTFCFFKNLPWFYVSNTERLLYTNEGKDQVSYIICLRIHKKRIQEFFLTKIKDLYIKNKGIPVYLIMPWYVDQIGSLKSSVNLKIKNSLFSRLENDIEESLNTTNNKVSALLYGEPGNGKTSSIRYFANKYQLPVYFISFRNDWGNHEILRVFSQIPKKCIVAIEDFDRYFDKSTPLLIDQKFTLDTILNAMDGLYKTYEQVFMFITANDISKIDIALKSRPSRIKYLIHLDNPSKETREAMLPKIWADASDGMSMDRVCYLQYCHEIGMSLREALDSLEIKNITLEKDNKCSENHTS